MEAPVTLQNDSMQIDNNSSLYIKVMKKSCMVSEYEKDHERVSEAKTLLEKLNNNETDFVSYLYQYFLETKEKR